MAEDSRHLLISRAQHGKFIKNTCSEMKQNQKNAGCGWQKGTFEAAAGVRPEG